LERALKDNLFFEVGELVRDDLFNRRKFHSVAFEVLEREPDEYNTFKKSILDLWNEFRIENEKRKFKYKYITFFEKNFDDILKNYISSYLDYPLKNLEIISKESVTDNDLYLEYKYRFSSLEIKSIKRIKEELDHPLEMSRFIPFIFDLLIQLLGKIIRKVIKKEIWVSQRGARIIKEGKRQVLHFLITIRRSPGEILDRYFDFILYNYTLKYPQIPKTIRNNLLKGRNKLTKIALENYFTARDNLVDIIYNFYKKCTLLETVSPFLDFLNFVCSRVEDSIFDTTDVIKEDFLSNLGYSPEVNDALIRIFTFINKYSTLFCTFQANNRPAFIEQYNLFLLYLQFFFGRGLEALEIGDLLFFPEKFSELIKEYNLTEKEKITFKTIRAIGYFSNVAFSLSKLPDIDFFFSKFLDKSITRMNETFFMCFLKSINEKFKSLIKKENDKLKKSNNYISFDKVIDFICRSLYTLINSVFLRDSLDEASRNFIDPRSRYIPENIALRVLELDMFKELNLSDDIWDDYIISINKEKVLDMFGKYIDIREDSFYSHWSLSMLDMIYNQELFQDEKYLEEFLITEIVGPLNKFIRKFNDAMAKSTNKNQIKKKFLEMITDGTEEKEKLKSLEVIIENLIENWDTSV